MPSARLFLPLALLTAPLHASLNEVLYARQLLDHITPARVVRFELADAAGVSPTPVYSLIFAFNHVLWAYLPMDGSVPLGPLDGPARLTPELITRRLNDADARIRNITVYDNDGSGRRHQPRALDNGCFLGCILELVNLLENGTGIREAGIVFFTGESPGPGAPASRLFAHQGHAILVYRTAHYWLGYDPNTSGQPIDLSDVRMGAPADPQLLRHAGRLNYPVHRARYLPVSADTLQRLGNDIVWLRRLERRSTASLIF